MIFKKKQLVKTIWTQSIHFGSQSEETVYYNKEIRLPGAQIAGSVPSTVRKQQTEKDVAVKLTLLFLLRQGHQTME